jgi:CBS domain containing-hemolysin-like protein
VRPARLVVTLIHPAVAVMRALGVLLLRPLGWYPAHPTAAESDESKLGNAESIRDLVETAQASGVIEEGGRELFESIFDFGDTRVHEVMIPRTDITALSLDAPAEKIIETLQATGFSRVPLHEGSLDNIAGILHAKDVMAALARGRHDFVAADLKRDAVYLPESQKIDEALAVMRAARNHLAIVIDEYGGTAGLLTVEDILEELVGDISDEHDPASNEPLNILGPDTALVDASLHTDDLSDRFDLALPTGQFDTVGGFMIEQLGRALLRGDKIELPNALLTVLSLRAGRPHIIRIDRKPPPAAEPAPTPHRE